MISHLILVILAGCIFPTIKCETPTGEHNIAVEERITSEERSAENWRTKRHINVIKLELQMQEIFNEIENVKKQDEETNQKIITALESIRLKFDNIEIHVGKMESKIDNIESKIDNLEAKIDNTDAKLGDIEVKNDNMDAKLSKMNTKIDKIYEKSDNMDAKIENMDSKLDTVDGKVENIDPKMDSLEVKIDSVDGKMENIDPKIDNMEVKIDDMNAKIDNIEMKIDNTVAQNDFVMRRAEGTLNENENNIQHRELLARLDALLKSEPNSMMGTMTNAMLRKLDDIISRTNTMTETILKMTSETNEMNSIVKDMATKSNMITPSITDIRTKIDQVSVHNNEIARQINQTSLNTDAIHSKVQAVTDWVEEMTKSVLFQNCYTLKKQFSWLKSGVYTIYPSNTSQAKTVYCDMKSKGGGWTVLQRRGYDSSITFNRTWDEYSTGFGNPSIEDYWLGLETIHDLTQHCNNEMMMTGVDNNGTLFYIRYLKFTVANRSDLYKLTLDSHQSTLSSINLLNSKVYYLAKRNFSTYDQDNDNNGTENCANKYESGWWYGACFNINPNGKIFGGRRIYWLDNWDGKPEYVRQTEVKIRPYCD